MINLCAFTIHLQTKLKAMTMKKKLSLISVALLLSISSLAWSQNRVDLSDGGDSATMTFTNSTDKTCITYISVYVRDPSAIGGARWINKYSGEVTVKPNSTYSQDLYWSGGTEWKHKVTNSYCK